jgi:hypothetical protein
VARTYKHEERLDLTARTDPWPLLERVENFLTQRVRTVGTGDFGGAVTVEGPSGSGRYNSVAEARADYEGSRHEVHRIFLLVIENFEVAEPNDTVPEERRGADKLHTYTATFWRSPHESYVSLAGQGPDEAEAVGLTKVMLREAKALVVPAAESLRGHEAVVRNVPIRVTPLALPEPARALWWKQAINHPWTVTLVGGLIVGLIVLWVTLRAS